MKINPTLATLASLTTLVHALPNAVQFDRRQFTNTTASLNGTSSTTAPGGGAGVGAGALSTGVTTQTVVQTVVSTVSQLYTTYPVTNLFTETIVIPGAGAGVAPVATAIAGTPPVAVVAGSTSSGTGSSSGSSGSTSGTDTGSTGSDSGSSGTGSTGSSGSDSGSACVCSVPAVVATGIYTVTVENVVDLGTTTYTTAYPTTTLGVFTVSAGTIVPAVATVTNSAVVATNTNAALAPGQSYQTITVPGTSTTIVVVVSVVSDVVAPVAGNNGGNGVGAQPNTATSTAPYTNSSTTSTTLGNGGAGVGAGQMTLSSYLSSSTAPAAVAIGGAVSATSTPLSDAIAAATATTSTASTATATPSLYPGTLATVVGDLGTTPLLTQDAFISAMLNYHNELRARNSAPPMTWNPTLAEFALANANKNAADRTFLHTTEMGLTNPYGENIGTMYGYNNPSYLIWAMYEEYKSYDYTNPVFSTTTGHFTQIVWLSSTELGCAFTQADDANGNYYLACEYSPPGNYEGQFAANVLPSTTDVEPVEPPTNI